MPAHAQQLTGTLSATVYDSTGAVVPGATVTLKNADSGDVRKTVSDGSGYFTFTAVQPATYSITVAAKGFTTWKLSGVVMNLGDSKTVPNIALKAGSEGTTVEVVADKNVEVPLDTPEISTTMNAEQIEDMSLGGRDAGELLKMMPGAAFTNGGSQGSAFNPQVTGTNSGPIGDYSLNGTQPYGSTAYMLDGANLVDPGNAGTQIANINQDMVQEVKVLTGSYGAEYAYGPVIFEAFSKSGGKNLHGEGYMYARNSTLNSWESYAKETYNSNITSATTPANAASLAAIGYPYEYFYYVGGNVGGPVVLPWVNFNKNHNKLFFWGGYEYMIQHP
ncbi:MAG: carboxypeptidase regulatory-like domain-containing protein, partial [Acidobacteriaceae bacterium]